MADFSNIYNRHESSKTIFNHDYKIKGGVKCGTELKTTLATVQVIADKLDGYYSRTKK